jgi:hypothetical protein
MNEHTNEKRTIELVMDIHENGTVDIVGNKVDNRVSQTLYPLLDIETEVETEVGMDLLVL